MSYLIKRISDGKFVTSSEPLLVVDGETGALSFETEAQAADEAETLSIETMEDYEPVSASPTSPGNPSGGGTTENPPPPTQRPDDR